MNTFFVLFAALGLGTQRWVGHCACPPGTLVTDVPSWAEHALSGGGEIANSFSLVLTLQEQPISFSNDDVLCLFPLSGPWFQTQNSARRTKGCQSKKGPERPSMPGALRFQRAAD